MQRHIVAPIGMLVSYAIVPAEPRSADCPGHDAHPEIISVTIGGHLLMRHVLHDDDMVGIEEALGDSLAGEEER